jgi:hypothetical protein
LKGKKSRLKLIGISSKDILKEKKSQLNIWSGLTGFTPELNHDGIKKRHKMETVLFGVDCQRQSTPFAFLAKNFGIIKK